MSKMSGIFIAKGKKQLYLLPKMACCHGLIAGTSYKDRTTTLQAMAEGFSLEGIPVFLTDVKGDLSGICIPGEGIGEINERIETLGLKDYEYRSFPVILWDLFGVQGHPFRTTVSGMGPLLLSKLLGLNQNQSSALDTVFRVADGTGMLLLDLKDLKAMLKYVSDNPGRLPKESGSVSRKAAETILQKLLDLEERGGNKFFGEPDLRFPDLLKTDNSGVGYINILDSVKLIDFPSIYVAFLLWLLSELLEGLPEINDGEKPKIIVFINEANLFFDDMSRTLLKKIEQLLKHIRYKGVGVYFITENPTSIPIEIIDQLKNIIQHKVSLFTPREQKTAKLISEIFRPNPELNISGAINELDLGEALVSFLDEEGYPSMAERALILPPRSYCINPITKEYREQIIKDSCLYGIYDRMFDRISAYENLQDEILRKEMKTAVSSSKDDISEKQTNHDKIPKREAVSKNISKKQRTTDSPLEKMAKSAMSSIGREVGRELIRGILESLKK